MVHAAWREDAPQLPRQRQDSLTTAPSPMSSPSNEATPPSTSPPVWQKSDRPTVQGSERRVGNNRDANRVKDGDVTPGNAAAPPEADPSAEAREVIRRRIVISGDVGMDSNIAIRPDRRYDREIRNIVSRPGGAFLPHCILHELLGRSNGVEILGQYLRKEPTKQTPFTTVCLRALFQAPTDESVDDPGGGDAWFDDSDERTEKLNSLLSGLLEKERVEIQSDSYAQFVRRELTLRAPTKADERLYALRRERILDWSERRMATHILDQLDRAVQAKTSRSIPKGEWESIRMEFQRQEPVQRAGELLRKSFLKQVRYPLPDGKHTDDLEDKRANVERVVRTLRQESWRISEVLGVGRHLLPEVRRGATSGPTAGPPEKLSDAGLTGQEAADLLVFIDAGYGFDRCVRLADEEQESGRDSDAPATTEDESVVDLLFSRYMDSRTVLLYRYDFRMEERVGRPRPLVDRLIAWLDPGVEPGAARRIREVRRSPQRTVVTILRIEDVRRAGILISEGISWEKTCTDVVNEILQSAIDGKSPARVRLRRLFEIGWVVISFDLSGVLLARLDEDGLRVHMHLVWDTRFQEGEWAADLPGRIYGRTATLTACIARAIYRVLEQEPAPPTPVPLRDLTEQILEGMRLGLAAARYVHVAGFSDDEPEDPLETSLSYPFKQVGWILNGPRRDPEGGGDSNGPHDFVAYVAERICSTKVELQSDSGWVRPWTFLHRHRRPLKQLAIDIATGGLDELRDTPVVQYGNLQVVDRGEVEALNSIKYLVENYLSSSETRPFSFAVFGEPGSGKSYGIKQLAGDISTKIRAHEFNLSQFSSVNDLHDAFHVVRNESFRGEVPLAIWDEFDCAFEGEDLYWLQRFLMPMQDGKFRQHQSEHPIGKAIFVFSGGTRFTFEQFVKDMENQRKMKVPDFVSRLRGHINVLGSNRSDSSGEGQSPSNDTFMIRRAVFMHFILPRYGPNIARGEKRMVHPSVLNAFLTIPRYLHGFRSIEAIISMSRLQNQTEFNPASLPPEEQLKGHVDPQHFMKLVYGGE